MKLKNLIDLLPYQYKEKDTYKVDGKGILERFLEICGSHLDDYVTKDIEGILDLIDLDNVPKMYLNYIWEYFGAFPFAYGANIDQDKFNRYYNGFKSKDELDNLSKFWEIQKQGPIVLSEDKVRRVLKYAITLTRIRGTKQFFKTLFSLYGFNCDIIDPTIKKPYSEIANYIFRSDVEVTEGGIERVDPQTPLTEEDLYFRYMGPKLVGDVVKISDDGSLSVVDPEGNILATNEDGSTIIKEEIKDFSYQLNNWIDDKPIMDSPYYLYDRSTFDEDPRCNQCIEAYFNINTNDEFLSIDDEYFRDSQAIIFSGKYDQAIDLNKRVLDYNGIISMASVNEDEYVNNNISLIANGDLPASVTDFIAFRRMVNALFDSYLPYNVKAHVAYQGHEVDDNLAITTKVIDPYDTINPSNIYYGKKDYVEVQVDVTTPVTGLPIDTRFVISGDGGKTWGEPHNSGEHIKFTTQGTYLIRAYDYNEYIGVPQETIVVDSCMLNSWYTLQYQTPDGTSFGPSVDTLRVRLLGLRHDQFANEQGTGVGGETTTKVNVLKLVGNTTSPKTTYTDSEGNVWDEWTYKITDGVSTYGIQRLEFGIQENINSRVTITLDKAKEYAMGSIDPTSISVTKGNLLVPKKYVTLYPTTTYGDDTAKSCVRMKCLNTGKEYAYGEKMFISSDIPLKFEVVRHLTGDTTHDNRAKGIVFEDTEDHHTKFTFNVYWIKPIEVQVTTPNLVSYLTVTKRSLDLTCTLTYTGDVPEGSTIDTTVKVLVDNIGTGVTFDAKEGNTNKYTVTKACKVTFVSNYDPTSSVTVQVIDSGKIIDFGPKLMISPSKPLDSNWTTEFSDTITEVSEATATGEVKFTLHLYDVATAEISQVVQVQDKDWNILGIAEVDKELTYSDIGTYHFVYLETNTIATLTILHTLES